MKIPHLTSEQKERVIQTIEEMGREVATLQSAIQAAGAHVQRQEALVDEYNTLRAGTEVSRKLSLQLMAIKEERQMLLEQNPRYAKDIESQAKELKRSLYVASALTKEIALQLSGVIEGKMRRAFAPFYSDQRNFADMIGNSDAMGLIRSFLATRGQVPLAMTAPEVVLGYATGSLEILRRIRDGEDVLTFTGCTLDGEQAPATL